MSNRLRKGIFIWEDTSQTHERHVFITYASLWVRPADTEKDPFRYRQHYFSVAIGPPGGKLERIDRISDVDQDGTPDDAALLEMANLFVAMNIHPNLYP